MKINLTNGVSYGAKITVTADMLDTDGNLVVEFVGVSDYLVDYDLAVIATVNGVLATPTVDGATVTFANASADDEVVIIAQRAIVK